MNRSSAVSLAVALLVGSVWLGGCSSSSFLGRQWENFTAYYNTFYNAKQSFRQAEQAIIEGEERIDRDRYLPVYPLPDQVSQRSVLSSAVEKSAKLLREHRDSKFVEDALLIIGKSYYYQHNFAGAEEKFREVMALESERSDEARLWLARTLKATEAYGSAITLIEERLSTNDPNEDWFPRMRLMLGELYVAQDDLDQAVSALEEGLAEADDDRAGARGQFLLAQVYEAMDRYEQAADAYDAVGDFGPVYELGYAAQLSYVEVVGLHLDAERGLDVLASMQRDDKHYERRDELALVRGQILKEAGRTRDARAIYRAILYDRGTTGGPQASAPRLGADLERRVHYRLAELYRDNEVAYSLAAAHFDSAAGSGGSGPRQESERELRLLPDAVTGVAETAELFGRFREVAEEINRMDSLLHLGRLDRAAFDSVIAAIQMRRAERARARRERMQEQQSQRSFQSRSRSLSNQQSSSDGGATQSAVDAASGEAGFLFHNDAVELQRSRTQFELEWGDRPLVPNWRRREAIRSSDTADRQVAANEAVDDPTGAGGEADRFLPPVDTSAVPRDSVARLEMRGRRAEARYRLGNILFLMMNEPDSAATWYRRVIEEDGEFPVAARAFYALAEVRKAQGDSASARRLNRELVRRYPGSSLAARIKRSLERQRTASEATVDTLALARSAYERAYYAWQEGGRSAEALDGMLVTARRYPGTPYAPRALLAACYIVQERSPGARSGPGNTIPLPSPSLCCDPLGTPRVGRIDSAGTGSEQGSYFGRPVSLEGIFAILEERYPESPYARRAQNLRAFVVGTDSTGQFAQRLSPDARSEPVDRGESTSSGPRTVPPDSVQAPSRQDAR